MAKKTFFQGAVILAAAGVIIKALGAVFRIPLGNMISDLGMGYYQTAYTIYVMFLVLSNSGLPVAISRMVSERVAIGNYDGAHRVFRLSFILLFIIGFTSFYMCFFQTEFLLGFFSNMGASVFAVRAIAPALLIVPLMAAFRGYFQGMQNMRPTANSQVSEQFFRVAAGLALAYILLPRGEQYAAAGAAFGATSGAFFGLITVILIYFMYKRQRRERGGSARARTGDGGSAAGARAGDGGPAAGARAGDGGSAAGARAGDGGSAAGARAGDGGSATRARAGDGGSATWARAGDGGSATRARTGDGEPAAGARAGDARRKRRSEKQEAAGRILLRIFAIAVPITIGAAIMPIMNMIDLKIISTRLGYLGWVDSEVLKAYGQLAGFANPLINLPQILTQAVAMSLVPAVAAAFKRKDTEFLRHNISLGLRTAIIIGLPCAFGMMTIPGNILLLLYPAEPEAALSAAPFLFILAFGIIFLSTVQTLTGVLQGIGKQMIPVVNLSVGVVVKVIVSLSLISVPSINIKGVAVGTVCAYIIAATLNLLAVRRYTGTKFDIYLTFVKPGIAAAVMSLTVMLSRRLCILILGGGGFAGAAISTILAVGAGAAAYVLMIFITGAITEEELRMLPRGAKIAALFAKFGSKKRSKKQ
ncbi:MAG: polysaccharide biosynthesis protein [Clostridiales Family XIII bacterium]|jgi:O-antigen/teichoic acid export membrane protein|nr:polysaccharide biosynthesis protein [Clostridiales Family XIII bacterium]